jgi:cytoskeletal protein CcmA (bactofilin family)
MSIFSRKKTETEGASAMSDTPDLGLPPKPPAAANRPLGTATPVRPIGAAPASSPGTPAITPPAATPLTPRPAETPRRAEGHAPIIPTPKRDSEMRRLIVGREISLTGEITSCERLVVEGTVEANLNNCREIEIAEAGLMKGTAAIEEAEIRGRYEGSLTVRKRLLIRATGKVSGMVRYGQLEIEAGGQISGDVQSQPGAEDHAPQRVVNLPGDYKV